MILPIIIYVQFHEIMDNRPFVKIICLIPNRIPFATNNICTEYWDDWIFIFNIRFFAFSILLENILIKISLNIFERKLKLYTINRFDFYTKYCTLSWLLKSILQIHEYINFKKKKIIEADSLQFEQWPKRIHWRCKKLLYLWYAYASSF